MCGIVAVWSPEPQPLVAERFAILMHEARVRGLHAFGAAWATPVTRVVGDNLDELLGFVDERALDVPFAALIGHTRYSTSGDWREPLNNQPIVAAGRALVFNGVIHMGTKPEFEQAFGVECETANDGEVFLRRLELGDDPLTFVRSMRGSFAGAWFDPDGRLCALRNDRRPLWWARDEDRVLIASTRDIFARAELGPPVEVEPLVLFRPELA